MLREHERTQSKLKEDLGQLVLSALSDDEIFEIMLNPDGTLWVEGFARIQFRAWPRELPIKKAQVLEGNFGLSSIMNLSYIDFKPLCRQL